MNSTLLRTQTDDRDDAVYNGRPIQLTAPPLPIYHPVFATFKQQIGEPIEFTSAEFYPCLLSHQYFYQPTHQRPSIRTLLARSYPFKRLQTHKLHRRKLWSLPPLLFSLLLLPLHYLTGTLDATIFLYQPLAYIGITSNPVLLFSSLFRSRQCL